MVNFNQNIFYHLVEKHQQDVIKNKIALISESDSYTYNDLYLASLKIHHFCLINKIASKTEVILLLHDNCFSFAVFLGLIRAGVVPIYVNPNLLAYQIKQIFELTKASVVFFSNDLSYQVKSFITQTIMQSFEINNDFISNLQVDYYIPFYFDSLESSAFGLFSSGSTGLPKGIIHRHKDVIIMNNNYMKNVIKLTSNDIVLTTSKAFFAYGLNSILASLYYGSTLIFSDRKLNPSKIWNLLSNNQVTVLFSVPTVYGLLLKEKRPEKLTIRLAISAGESLPKQLQNLWIESYGHFIIDGIGTTETLSTFISNNEKEFKLGSTGKLLPGFKAKLIKNNKQVCTDTVGVLLVKGDTYPFEYINNQTLTQKHFKNGWFLTQDLFSKDQEGFYYYHGRANELFKCGGRWISPYKIENLLCNHPFVEDCIVVGKRNEIGLIRPIAFLKMKHDKHKNVDTLNQLTALCKAQLSSWEYPHFFEFLSILPRTSTGKKQRYKLMEEE